MRDSKGKHIDEDIREAIQEGIGRGDSARSIAKSTGVSPSTVTREVRANRTVRVPSRRDGAKLAVRCARYRECEAAGTACEGCAHRYTPCRSCRSRSCIDSCPDFELRMCPTTESWPYVCPAGCPRRSWCSLPKCRYVASEAQAAHDARLAASRSGIDASAEQLERVNAIVVPLALRGHSFEAIHAAHGDELGVSVRTLYNWQESGALRVKAIEMPMKVRLRPRKRAAPKGRPRVDRTGRTHDDFLALPLEERARVVQLDSVEGHATCATDVLSLQLVARGAQVYMKKGHADAAETVARLDDLERAMGSRPAFEAAFGVMLADRGVEFDDWEGMERSCLEPGGRRCRVFYCDAMDSNQKSECERNHEQLRRILPKGRTDMDLLSAADVAECCSHVNSYPLARLGGLCPFDVLGALVPPSALGALGIRRVPPDEVVLRPWLMRHAVEQ